MTMFLRFKPSLVGIAGSRFGEGKENWQCAGSLKCYHPEGFAKSFIGMAGQKELCKPHEFPWVQQQTRVEIA